MKAKAEWAQSWTADPDASFAARLVAFAAVEGVFDAPKITGMLLEMPNAALLDTVVTPQLLRRHVRHHLLLLHHRMQTARNGARHAAAAAEHLLPVHPSARD